MRIDFIISSLGGGGAERVLSLVTNNLVRNPDFKLVVITLNSSIEAYPLHTDIDRIKFKKNKNIPTSTLSSFYSLIKYYKKKSNRPDVIVSFGTTTNFITIIIAKIFSIRIIAQEHISHVGSSDNRMNTIKITRQYLYRIADAITVLTSYDVEYYKKFGAEVIVMPNPCSFKAISDNTNIRKKTILAVGSLNRYHHKGFDNLIKLVATVLEKHPDWNLKIAGSGDEGLKYLSSLTKEYGISDKVIFTGFISDISSLMSESSIFILSSRFEGLPMVLLEAMSQGMACIAFNCLTGPSDIIINNKNGLLIENQNLKDMQSGLLQLIENKELRQSLSNEGIKSLEKFEISAVTRRYEELFNNLLDKK